MFFDSELIKAEVTVPYSLVEVIVGESKTHANLGIAIDQVNPDNIEGLGIDPGNTGVYEASLFDADQLTNQVRTNRLMLNPCDTLGTLGKRYSLAKGYIVDGTVYHKEGTLTEMQSLVQVMALVSDYRDDILLKCGVVSAILKYDKSTGERRWQLANIENCPYENVWAKFQEFLDDNHISRATSDWQASDHFQN